MTRRLIYLFITLFLFSLSCEVWMDFSQPEIISISPEANESITSLRPSISVTFSKAMNKAVTEKAFQVKGGKTTPVGRYRWEDNELFFDLQADLDMGQKYTITILADAECLNGNNIVDLREQVFYTGTDRINPVITSQLILHSNNTTTELTDGFIGVNTSDAVQFCFSESMSQNQLDSRISVKPSVIGSFIISNNDQCFAFKPYRKFDHGKVYTFTVTEMEDLSGNVLLEDKVVTFTCGNDLVAPNLTDNGASVKIGAIQLKTDELTNLVEKDSDIVITFSEEMDRLSTQDSITIDPPVDYIIEWGQDKRTITIKHKNNSIFELNRIYTLTIKKTAKDIAGNEMKNDYSAVFRVNGLNSQFLSVDSVFQVGKNANDTSIEVLMPVSDPFSYINLTENYPFEINDQETVYVNCVETFEPTEIESENIKYYVVRLNITDKRPDLSSLNLNLFNVIKNISFTFDSSYDQPSDDFNNVGSPAILKTILKNTEDNSKSCIELHLFGIKDKSYLKLKITGGKDGLKSDDGNYLEDDFILMLKT